MTKTTSPSSSYKKYNVATALFFLCIFGNVLTFRLPVTRRFEKRHHIAEHSERTFFVGKKLNRKESPFASTFGLPSVVGDIRQRDGGIIWTIRSVVKWVKTFIRHLFQLFFPASAEKTRKTGETTGKGSMYSGESNYNYYEGTVVKKATENVPKVKNVPDIDVGKIASTRSNNVQIDNKDTGSGSSGANTVGSQGSGGSGGGGGGEKEDKTEKVERGRERKDADKSYAERKLLEIETLQLETANNRVSKRKKDEAAAKWVTSSLDGLERGERGVGRGEKSDGGEGSEGVRSESGRNNNNTYNDDDEEDDVNYDNTDNIIVNSNKEDIIVNRKEIMKENVEEKKVNGGFYKNLITPAITVEKNGKNEKNSVEQNSYIINKNGNNKNINDKMKESNSIINDIKNEITNDIKKNSKNEKNEKSESKENLKIENEKNGNSEDDKNEKTYAYNSKPNLNVILKKNIKDSLYPINLDGSFTRYDTKTLRAETDPISDFVSNSIKISERVELDRRNNKNYENYENRDSSGDFENGENRENNESAESTDSSESSDSTEVIENVVIRENNENNENRGNAEHKGNSGFYKKPEVMDNTVTDEITGNAEVSEITDVAITGGGIEMMEEGEKNIENNENNENSNIDQEVERLNNAERFSPPVFNPVPLPPSPSLPPPPALPSVFPAATPVATTVVESNLEEDEEIISTSSSTSSLLSSPTSPSSTSTFSSTVLPYSTQVTNEEIVNEKEKENENETVSDITSKAENENEKEVEEEQQEEEDDDDTSPPSTLTPAPYSSPSFSTYTPPIPSTPTAPRCLLGNWEMSERRYLDADRMLLSESFFDNITIPSFGSLSSSVSGSKGLEWRADKAEKISTAEMGDNNNDNNSNSYGKKMIGESRSELLYGDKEHSSEERSSEGSEEGSSEPFDEYTVELNIVRGCSSTEWMKAKGRNEKIITARIIKPPKDAYEQRPTLCTYSGVLTGERRIQGLVYSTPVTLEGEKRLVGEFEMIRI